jgi:hypothetical protein
MSKRKRYQCTECLTVHTSFSKAARCHQYIGGVVEEGDPYWVEEEEAS